MDIQKIKKFIDSLFDPEYLKEVNTLEKLEKIKIDFLGKKGIFTSEISKLKNLSKEEKITNAKELNALKNKFLEFYEKYKDELDSNKKPTPTKSDITLPVYDEVGKIHPLRSCRSRAIKIMKDLGFEFEDGPSVENCYYNFDALNIPKDHPSRNERDTFYIKESADSKEKRNILRTHTTAVQIRALESGKYSDNFKVFSIGDVYRRDDDTTHLPMFHQIEGFVVSEEASLATLKHFLLSFLKMFFEKEDLEIRFRPGFFPFTEPSVEVDIKFKSGNWLELLGAGMIRKNIMEKYNMKKGFAFGIGLERITMIKLGLNNMNDFVKNDLYWLKTYGYSSFEHICYS